MDVLSETLKIIRLSGAIFFTAQVSGRWAVSSPPSDELSGLMNAKSDCIVLFHVVTSGQCMVRIKNKEPFILEEGSMILLPHSISHTIGNNMKIKPDPVGDFVNFNQKEIPNINYSRDGEGDVKLICGYLKCNQYFNPLIKSLPEVIMLSTQKNTIDKNVRNHPALRSKTFTIHPGGWIDQTIGFLNTEIEHKNMGSGTIITRLTELLFVEILRRYVSQIPESDRGWLAGLKDPKVGMALQLLHNQPGKKWNVSQLAQAVGVSRSALAKRFHDIIGESPIKYLTEWRMQLAKNLLQTKELSLIEIAEQVGYESEIAFNRAFKRCTGTPPACWRDRVLNDSIGK